MDHPTEAEVAAIIDRQLPSGDERRALAELELKGTCRIITISTIWTPQIQSADIFYTN